MSHTRRICFACGLGQHTITHGAGSHCTSLLLFLLGQYLCKPAMLRRQPCQMLFLDEPSAAVDAGAKRHLWKVIKSRGPDQQLVTFNRANSTENFENGGAGSKDVAISGYLFMCIYVYIYIRIDDYICIIYVLYVSPLKMEKPSASCGVK